MSRRACDLVHKERIGATFGPSAKSGILAPLSK